MEKAFAKDTSAIMQRWNLDCMYRLTVSKGRIDDSESPLLNGLYLITEIHREVVVPLGLDWGYMGLDWVA